MTISDIITTISLVIAIVAIISEKNRKHLLLKFSHFDFSLYIFAFLMINYFVFYYQFYSNGYYFDFLYFENFGLRNPSNYSYIISIFVLVSILFKILLSFYPNRKINKVLRYYRSLIENNEIPMLLDLIEKYHIKDIKKYIRASKDYNPDSDAWMLERFRKTSLKEKVSNKLKDAWKNINKYSVSNKYNYAKNVLHNIINDHAFVALAANIRPYMFARIFEDFKKEKRNSFPDELINQFLIELLKERNFWLIKELKQTANFDSGQPDWFFNENKIIASLIQNLSVADVNQIWQPFGEEAMKEIDEENNMGANSRLFQQYRNDDLLWEYKLFISINFFNILIIESIVKKYSGTHFHLHYYWIFTEKILKIFETSPPKDFEKIDTYFHYLIKIINDNIFHWLRLANKYENDRFYDIISCIGSQINCLTKNPYFGEKRKIDFIERILTFYCNVEEKAKTKLIRDELDKILIKPNMLTEKDDPYFDYIRQVWKKFDKFPHRNDVGKYDYDYFVRLKKNVIKPLGLNPDEY